MNLQVGPGAERHLEAINEIYNHYVLTSPATFDIEPIAMEARREWFTHYQPSGRHRLLVAGEGEHVLGYATSSRFRPRAAYDTSVEMTTYVAPEACGRGVGKALYEAILAELEHEDIHRAYAGITMPNDASVGLHVHFGFERVGLFTEQGRKFGRWWDVAWYEKKLA
jgi:phosphinothricin acetyltransferase